MTQSSNTEAFLDISAWLTGFDQASLQATGMTDTYFQTLTQKSNATTLAEFSSQAAR